MLEQLPYIAAATVICLVLFVVIDILWKLPKKGGVSGAEAIANDIEATGGNKHGGYMIGNIITSPDASAGTLLAACGFFIYGVNSLVWAFATDIGGRVFAGTAAGILDWAAYMAAAMQSMFFGSILDSTGNWNVVMLTVAGACLSMVVLALIAKPRKAK
jgi:energy-converting hydrogenase Eha subunit B